MQYLSDVFTDIVKIVVDKTKGVGNYRKILNLKVERMATDGNGDPPKGPDLRNEDMETSTIKSFLDNGSLDEVEIEDLASMIKYASELDKECEEKVKALVENKVPSHKTVPTILEIIQSFHIKNADRVSKAEIETAELKVQVIKNTKAISNMKLETKNRLKKINKEVTKNTMAREGQGSGLNESVDEEWIERATREVWNEQMNTYRKSKCSEEASNFHCYFLHQDNCAKFEEDLPGKTVQNVNDLATVAEKIKYECRYNAHIVLLSKFWPSGWREAIKDYKEHKTANKAYKYNACFKLVRDYLVNTLNKSEKWADFVMTTVVSIKPSETVYNVMRDNPRYPSELEVTFVTELDAHRIFSTSCRYINPYNGMPKGSIKIKVTEPLMTKYRFLVEQQHKIKRLPCDDDPTKTMSACTRYSTKKEDGDDPNLMGIRIWFKRSKSPGTCWLLATEYEANVIVPVWVEPADAAGYGYPIRADKDVTQEYLGVQNSGEAAASAAAGVDNTEEDWTAVSYKNQRNGQLMEKWANKGNARGRGGYISDVSSTSSGGSSYGRGRGNYENMNGVNISSDPQNTGRGSGRGRGRGRGNQRGTQRGRDYFNAQGRIINPRGRATVYNRQNANPKVIQAYLVTETEESGCSLGLPGYTESPSRFPSESGKTNTKKRARKSGFESDSNSPPARHKLHCAGVGGPRGGSGLPAEERPTSDSSTSDPDYETYLAFMKFNEGRNKKKGTSISKDVVDDITALHS